MGTCINLTECVAALVFSCLFSFGLGAAIVFYIFIQSDMAHVIGLRRFFRKRVEDHNGRTTKE